MRTGVILEIILFANSSRAVAEMFILQGTHIYGRAHYSGIIFLVNEILLQVTPSPSLDC